MAIYHVEVHSRDRQIEHYIVPNTATRQEVIDRTRQFYADKGYRVGLWEREDDRANPQLPYLIFDITELPGEPVIYISGEYRSQFPV
jgi:hypothetical protein